MLLLENKHYTAVIIYLYTCLRAWHIISTFYVFEYIELGEYNEADR